jgi:hypothetical protein
MMAETRMDQLMMRLSDMNRLLDLRPSHEDEEGDESQESTKSGGKKGGKKGGKQGGGFFGTAVGEIFFRRNSEKRPGILGITHPSDGHPQEELTPDFGWFRPLSYNNMTWTLYWPELII